MAISRGHVALPLPLTDHGRRSRAIVCATRVAGISAKSALARSLGAVPDGEREENAIYYPLYTHGLAARHMNGQWGIEKMGRGSRRFLWLRARRA